MNLTSSSLNEYLNRLLKLALFAFLMLSLTVKKFSSNLIYLMMIVALIFLVLSIQSKSHSFKQVIFKYWPINLAMSSMFIAVSLHHAHEGYFYWDNYKIASRLIFFTILFWAMMHLPIKYLKTMQYSFVGCVIVNALAIFVFSEGGKIRPEKSMVMPLIPFSDLVLLIGFLALFTIEWANKKSKISVLSKILALVAGLYASFLSQTRGGWVAIPFFIIVCYRVFFERNKRRDLLVVVFITALLASSFMFSENVKNRFEHAKSDIISYMDGTDRSTSIGLRLDMWHASWIMFKENPVFGVGPNNYMDEMRKLVEQDIVHKAALDHEHSHNEILFQMAQLGIVGMIAIISIYLVPLCYFYKGIHHRDREMKAVAWMGITLCASFFIFGLTDVMFKWRAAGNYYIVLLAALFAYYVKLKQELNLKNA